MARQKQVGYPEPGAWVWDATQSLPNIHPPEPLPDRQLTQDEIFEYIAYEGLGHCLNSIPTASLKGKALQKLWSNAQDACRAIMIYVEDREIESLTPKAVDFGEDATDTLEI